MPEVTIFCEILSMTAHDEFLVLVVPIYTPSAADDTDHVHAAGSNVPTASCTTHRHLNQGFNESLPRVSSPAEVKPVHRGCS